MILLNSTATFYIGQWATNLLLSLSVLGPTALDIGRPETSSQANTPIIYEINQQIKFPYHIDLQLEATSTNKITDVVFYYTFHGQQTIIYGKPDFSPSKSIIFPLFCFCRVTSIIVRSCNWM